MSFSLTLQELAEKTKTTLVGNGDIVIRSVADIESATEHDISFLSNTRYHKYLSQTQASAVIISNDTSPLPGKNYLISPNPSATFQSCLELFHQKTQSGFSGIHESAVIHESAQIAKDVHIGPHCVVDAGAVIGNGSRLVASVFVGAQVEIGENCLLHPQSVVREGCVLKNRVILQPGAIIGSCGFGYDSSPAGHSKLEQLGSVILEDDVEVGASTTIDRGRFKPTLIGAGSKIDNLVQIGHGARIGKHCLLVGQSGVAGSTELGDFVVLAGQSGIAGHLKVASGCVIAGQSGVTKSLLEKDQYMGNPAQKASDWRRQQVQLRRLESFFKRLEELENQ